MSALRELYQEVILDHGKSPRNFGKPDGSNADAHGHNPLCGDTVTIHLKMDGDVIDDIGFEGRGCAISVASASMMTEILKGKTLPDAEDMFARFHALVAPDAAVCEPDFDAPDLEKLLVLAGVREFPMRVKCATLPWHTFKAATENSNAEMTTE